MPFTGKGGRIGRKVLIRADSGGGTHEFVDWLHARKLGYSLGFTLPDDAVQRITQSPDQAWTPAYDDERTPRDGAWVAEATGVLDLAARRIHLRLAAQPPGQPGPHRPPAPDHPARTDLTSPKPSLPTSITTGHVKPGATPVDKGANPPTPNTKRATEPPTPRRGARPSPREDPGLCPGPGH